MSHKLSEKLNSADLKAGTGISITDNTIACTVTAPTDYVKKDNGSLAIGSYAILALAIKTTVPSGSTITGSQLHLGYFYDDPDGLRYIYHAGTISGTWRNVNGFQMGFSSNKYRYIGLWQRIS